MITFIHTADWQLGKPFSRVADEEGRVRLRQERIDAVRRIGDVVRERNAAFVVVAGDLFDSNRCTNRTIADACAAIGSIGVPVHVIPGNHDHAGAGSIWEQEFFLAESRERAPNLRVHLEARPVEESGCVLLPCPLHRRQTASDPCGWIRDLDWNVFSDWPRILIAHGRKHARL
jgi:metallophosphoesterase superfamily enzyme